MKTFKLKSLKVIEDIDHLVHQDIPLLDGLIINREDSEDHWLIEAYINQSFTDYFKYLKSMSEELIIQVKITKETNDPATFIASIIDINDIGSNMNVLFLGQMVDVDKNRTEEILESLIAEGLQGDELLQKYKELI